LAVRYAESDFATLKSLMVKAPTRERFGVEGRFAQAQKTISRHTR